MLKLVVFLSLAAVPIVQATASSDQPTLMRGEEVDLDYFPEAIYIRNSNHARCSATIVGRYALLTAAHCVEDSAIITPVQSNMFSFVAFCEAHPRYEGENFDIALCKSDRPLPGRPASISQSRMHVGEKVLLTGFGCTHPSGPDGTFRIGMSTIYQLPMGQDTFFHTYHDATLCSGDSGGAAYYPMEDFREEKHYILGVNARSDMESRSLMTAIFNFDILDWMRRWSRSYRTRICGLNRECNYLRRPDTPRPEG